MLGDRRWLACSEYLPLEFRQSLEEGRDVERFAAEVENVISLPEHTAEKEHMSAELIDAMENAPIRENFAYEEPDGLEAITTLKDGLEKRYDISGNDIYDRVLGAWAGRCAGCLLGQPIECWKWERIEGFLKDTGNLPVTRYMSSDVSREIIDKYSVSNDGENAFCDNVTHWINNVSGMTEDDDTNYTIMGLKVLETYGQEFVSRDIAFTWLESLPLVHVSTAERAAYRNFANLIDPPVSGWFRNPYREWIGAQIRADIFGYVCPGNPKKAAELAWRDGRISHVKNGVYAEMMVAAMLAAAACEREPVQWVSQGLSQIPRTSRLYEAVKTVTDHFNGGRSFIQARKWLHERCDEDDSHMWCHALTNAMAVVIALLYGGGDFEKSVGLAMRLGFDTDCNGATVGSITGMANGYKNLPNSWLSPLKNGLRSGVSGYEKLSVEDTAKRTCRFIEKTISL